MCSYNMLKAWMQKDSDRPLGADKHLIAGTVAGTVPVYTVLTLFLRYQNSKEYYVIWNEVN